MPLYIFDTDSLSLYARGNENLITRRKRTPVSELAVTVVTVEEQISGWYDLVRRAQNAEQLERAYLRLSQAIELLSNFPVLPFTRAAIDRYEALKAAKLNVRKMDLRIASIALENDAVLITCNRRDFERVPGLRFEDWTETV